MKRKYKKKGGQIEEILTSNKKDMIKSKFPNTKISNVKFNPNLSPIEYSSIFKDKISKTQKLKNNLKPAKIPSAKKYKGLLTPIQEGSEFNRLIGKNFKPKIITVPKVEKEIKPKLSTAEMIELTKNNAPKSDMTQKMDILNSILKIRKGIKTKKINYKAQSAKEMAEENRRIFLREEEMKKKDKQKEETDKKNKQLSLFQANKVVERVMNENPIIRQNPDYGKILVDSVLDVKNVLDKQITIQQDILDTSKILAEQLINKVPEMSELSPNQVEEEKEKLIKIFEEELTKQTEQMNKMEEEYKQSKEKIATDIEDILNNIPEYTTFPEEQKENIKEEFKERIEEEFKEQLPPQEEKYPIEEEEEEEEEIEIDSTDPYATMENLPDALRIYELKQPYTKEQVIKKFRELSKTEHPDKGGDPETFKKIISYKDLLLKNVSLTTKVLRIMELEKLPNNSKISESLTSILKEYNLSGKPTNKNRDKLIRRIVDHEIKLGLLL